MTRPALMLGAIVALALVAGCSRAEAPEAPPQDVASDVAAPAPAALPEPPATPSASATDLPTTPASQPGGAAIPVALQGRWGLVPGDCTSTRGDAKGLLVIGPDTLRFYESSARAGSVSEETSTRIRANFAFSGEGSVWTREMLLETADGGKTLIRREYGGGSGPEPLIYTRC